MVCWAYRSHFDTNNYRGITLLSCLGKLFTLCLNARLTKKTFDRWKYLKSFSKFIFSKFDLCLAQNDETNYYYSLTFSHATNGTIIFCKFCCGDAEQIKTILA